MIVKLIKGFFVNFSIILFVLAIIIAILKIYLKPIKNNEERYEELYKWITLLGAGIVAIYAFAMHLFFPNIAAASIGWRNSPFQYEVAIANLGFGILCVLAFKASYGFRLASVIGMSCWLFGDALGHIKQMITMHNYTIGNAGSWFWSDILVPIFLITLIALMKKPQNSTSV